MAHSVFVAVGAVSPVGRGVSARANGEIATNTHTFTQPVAGGFRSERATRAETTDIRQSSLQCCTRCDRTDLQTTSGPEPVFPKLRTDQKRAMSWSSCHRLPALSLCDCEPPRPRGEGRASAKLVRQTSPSRKSQGGGVQSCCCRWLKVWAADKQGAGRTPPPVSRRYWPAINAIP